MLKLRKYVPNLHNLPKDVTDCIIQRVCQRIFAPIAAQLPKIASPSRAVQRIRKMNDINFHNPDTFDALVIDANHKVARKGEQFLLHDSGVEKERFIIFVTDKNLNQMSHYEV